MKILHIILLSALLFSNQSCKKERSNSENNVSCRINGIPFTNTKTISLFGSPSLHISNTSSNGFSLSASNFGDDQDPLNKNVIIRLNFIKTVGTYQLEELPNNASYEVSDTTSSLYTTDRNHQGEISFTVMDTVNHHYEGTFKFNAFWKQNGRSVNVTEGVFNFSEK